MLFQIILHICFAQILFKLQNFVTFVYLGSSLCRTESNMCTAGLYRVTQHVRKLWLWKLNLRNNSKKSVIMANVTQMTDDI